MRGEMKKKVHSSAFKFKVALEAIRGEKRAAHISAVVCDPDW